MPNSRIGVPADCVKNIWQEEEKRIRSVYAARNTSGKPALYRWWKADVLLNVYRFQVEVAAIFRRAGWEDLSTLRVLDVGCGSGDWLRQLCGWGACAANLHGIDFLPDRIARARELGPTIDFRVSDGWQFPFEDASFDLVTAHTVFSSILNATARKQLAAEMTRVLSSKGSIQIFDFRISHPGNPDTMGIRRREIRRLFPNFRLYSRSLELAPPIARRVASIAPLGRRQCEKVPL
jgi:SAM-dependent methyltransferase